MAVGFVVTDSEGDTVTLAERWDGRRWAFEGGLDAGLSDQFYAVSCVSARSCTAVGSFFNLTGTERPMIQRWNGDRWSFDLAERPAHASSGRLVAVSCRSPRVCTAVGSYRRRSGRPLALIEKSHPGEKWSVRIRPGQVDAAVGALNTVSCTSGDECTSMGSTQDGAAILAEHWNDRTWSSRAVPDPAGPLTSTLNGVSCASATTCIAVGSFEARPNAPAMPLVEAWDGVHWTEQTAPTPAGASSGQLNAVSCSSSDECTAVGTFSMSANGAPTELIEVLSGGAWKLQTAPEPANSALEGVSCAASTACVAVGYSGDNQMLAEVRDGSTWTIDSPSAPSGTTESRLDAVSCTSTTGCIAVGQVTEFEGGFTNTLAAAWNGSGWSLHTTFNATDAEDQFNAVSCAPMTCTAVGTNSDQTLSERWDGSRWTIENSPNLGRGTTGALKGVSCGSADACMAVGFAERSGKNGAVDRVLAEERVASGWAVVAAIGVSGAKLNQVSCVTVQACTAVGSFTTAAGLQLPLVGTFS